MTAKDQPELVKERILTEQVPQAYPRYQARTKMLIPFLLRSETGRVFGRSVLQAVAPKPA